MGEAKRKREALRQAAIVDIERWMDPPTDQEAELLAKIQALPIRRIGRATEEELRWARMKPQECHINCHSYCDLDPERKSKVVTGWWKRGDVYVCHSVVERDGGMLCITPYAMGASERSLEFIPDERIVWIKDDEGRLRPRRDNELVPYGVRCDPTKTIAECEYVKSRLLAGIHPQQALDLTEFKWPA